MTYLLVSHSSKLNGAERSLLELAQHLKKQQYPLIVLCPEEGLLVEALKAQEIPVFIKYLPPLDFKPSLFFKFLAGWLPYVWWLGRFLRQHQIKCVYNNTIASLYAPWATFFFRVPCLWHIREIRKNRRGRLLFVWALKFLPSMVVFNSQDTMLGYHSQPFPHWHVVYNGVQLPPFTRSISEKKPLTIGWVGQLEAHKRPELFIKIIEKIHEEFPHHVQALMAGDGVLREPLEAVVKEKDLIKTINFLGYVLNLQEVYSQLDILLLTSEQEGFGRVLVEAMAHGIPVVASNVGGVPEVVQHNITGFVVPDNDLQAFVTATKNLIENDTLRYQMGVAGYDYVKKNFLLTKYQQAISFYLDQLALK
jgi:glycosyltransferase involved in cell wall biosynthesis